ncbi:MAG: toast rack family protein [Bryobacteraceae bacterium]
MNQTRADRAVLAAISILMLSSPACIVEETKPSTIEHEAKTVDRNGAKSVQMDVEMSAGELKMRGGAASLLDAEFRYNSSARKPEVSYQVDGSVGRLTVKEPHHTTVGSNRKIEWDLRLNEDIPIDININLGAGQSRLDLGTIALHSLEVNMGAGDLKLDLTGHPRNDMDIRVNGGVGQATIRLPRRARLDVEAHGGLGSINANGLTKQGDRWVNEPQGNVDSTIHVNVSGGIGNINLICE